MFGRLLQQGLFIAVSTSLLFGCKPSLLDPLKLDGQTHKNFLYSPALLTIQAASPSGSSSTHPSIASFNGATPVGFAIKPALTNFPFLSFNTLTGAITQTAVAPSSVVNQETFTVTATTNRGVKTATVSLQVLITIPAPTLTYSPNPKLFTVGTMNSITPTVGGGGSSTFSIPSADHSALIAAGLSFDTTTGTLSGMATSAMASRVITVTASNIAGSATFDLTVEALVAASVTYAPNPKYFTVGQTSSISPTVTGTSLTYSIPTADDAALIAAGLAFDPSTGVFSGSATSAMASRVITVTATNSVSQTTFDLTVEALIAPSLSYNPSTQYFTVGQAGTITPTSTGTAVSFSIPAGDQTALTTAGLNFSTVTGAIGGTAIIPMALRTITVTASNLVGTATFDLTLAAQSPATIVFLPTTKYFTVGQNASISPTVTGSSLTYSIPTADEAALLAAGLSFSTSTGAVGGTATSVMALRTITVTASNAVTTAAASLTVAAFANPTQLVLTGSTTGLTTSCIPLSVQARDAGNAAVNLSADRTVALTGAGANGNYYAASNCTGPISSVVITAGSNSTTFYYRKTTPGTATLTSTSSPLTNGTLGVTISVAPPTTVTLSGTTTPTTASCAAYTITTKDEFGNASGVASTTSVSLSDGAAVGNFYATPICGIGGSPITTTSIAGGDSVAVVYYKMPITGTATLSANVSGIAASNNLNITVGVSTPAKISFSLNPSTTQNAGNCVEVTITSRDAGDNPINLTSGITVGLSATITTSGAATGVFYANSDCTGVITSTSMMSSTQTKVVYFTRTVTSTATQSTSLLGVKSGGGFADATATINYLPGLMYKMAWETVPAAGTMQAYNNLSWNGSTVPVVSSNTCSRFRLKVQDVYGNDTTAASGFSVSLAGEADGAFYNDADTNCDAPFTGATVAASAGFSNYFRYRKPTSGAVSITATAPGVVTTSAFTGTVSPGTPAQIVMATSPTTTKINACTAFRLEVRDSGNIIIPAPKGAGYATQLTQVSDGTFHTSSSCSVASTVSTVNIAASSNAVTFYYKKPTVSYPASTTIAFNETGSLTETGSPRSIVVSSGVASNLVHTTAPTSYNFNTCQTYTLQSRDENALASNPTSPININLSTTGVNGFFYATSGNCTAQTGAINSITIPTSTSSVNYFFRKNSAGAITNTVDSTGGVVKNFGLGITVTSPPVPPQLAFSGTNSLSIGICSPFTASRPNTSGGLITVALTTTGSIGIAYYVDPACTLSISQTRINSGAAATGTFYVMGVVPETGTLGVSATNYTAGSSSLTITP